jgi:hypothetical protein
MAEEKIQFSMVGQLGGLLFAGKENWKLLEKRGETVFSAKNAKCYKDYLRKQGIEPRKLPFQMSEDLIYVKPEDYDRALNLLKNVRLKDIC